MRVSSLVAAFTIAVAAAPTFAQNSEASLRTATLNFSAQGEVRIQLGEPKMSGSAYGTFEIAPR